MDCGRHRGHAGGRAGARRRSESRRAAGAVGWATERQRRATREPRAARHRGRAAARRAVGDQRRLPAATGSDAYHGTHRGRGDRVDCAHGDRRRHARGALRAPGSTRRAGSRWVDGRRRRRGGGRAWSPRRTLDLTGSPTPSTGQRRLRRGARRSHRRGAGAGGARDDCARCDRACHSPRRPDLRTVPCGRHTRRGCLRDGAALRRLHPAAPCRRRAVDRADGRVGLL